MSKTRENFTATLTKSQKKELRPKSCLSSHRSNSQTDMK